MSANQNKVSKRLTKEEYGLWLAFSASCRATCPRARVGCVLIDKNGNVVATGYNGSLPGDPHCDEVGCKIENGHCVRVKNHAEKNALNRAKSNGTYDHLKGGSAYVTIRPCNSSGCFDGLADAGIKKIVYLKEYNADTVADHQNKVCLDMDIAMKRFDSDVQNLMEKVVEFHQGPGGILSK
ncbi:MAG: hypothetical protein KGI60_00495 [Patescibacteria group bacterium]|nr:hypothetical protein [Patescibacteria group bacterium]